MGWPLSAGLQPTMAELRETEEGDPLYPKRRMKDWDRSWDREPLAVVKVATEEQVQSLRLVCHPGVEMRANLKSISHRCYLFEIACVRELTKQTIHLPLGCLQGGILPTTRSSFKSVFKQEVFS